MSGAATNLDLAKVAAPDTEANAAVETKQTVETKADKIEDKEVSALETLKTRAEETKELLKAKGDETKAVLKTKLDETKSMAVVAVDDMKIKARDTRDAASVMVRDPQFQTCTIVTAGGAITLSMVGGAFGLASGIVGGSTAGILPALFTFGLSIPAGGAVGGTCGLCAGTLLGGASGGLGGFTTYKYRLEINNGVMILKVRTQDILTGTKDRMVVVSTSTKDLLNGTKDRVLVVSTATKAKIAATVCQLNASVGDVACTTKKHSAAAVDLARVKASEALNFATKTKVGVTSSSAVAGAVVGGTSTGAFGIVAGAALGVIPAIFTFGLSIPVGATVGLCIGTSVGGSAGAVGGGLVGYGGYTHREAISEGVQSSCSKVSAKAEGLKTKTLTCAADAKRSVKSMIKASTGGSLD